MSGCLLWVIRVEREGKHTEGGGGVCVIGSSGGEQKRWGQFRVVGVLGGGPAMCCLVVEMRGGMGRGGRAEC